MAASLSPDMELSCWFWAVVNWLHMDNVLYHCQHWCQLFQTRCTNILALSSHSCNVNHLLLHRSEIESPEVNIRFALMLETYLRGSPNHVSELHKQVIINLLSHKPVPTNIFLHTCRLVPWSKWSRYLNFSILSNLKIRYIHMYRHHSVEQWQFTPLVGIYSYM